MFRFNLVKSANVCIKKCRYHTIFTTEPVEKIKHVVVLDVRSAAPPEAFARL